MEMKEETKDSDSRSLPTDENCIMLLLKQLQHRHSLLMTSRCMYWSVLSNTCGKCSSRQTLALTMPSSWRKRCRQRIRFVDLGAKKSVKSLRSKTLTRLHRETNFRALFATRRSSQTCCNCKLAISRKCVCCWSMRLAKRYACASSTWSAKCPSATTSTVRSIWACARSESKLAAALFEGIFSLTSTRAQ